MRNVETNQQFVMMTLSPDEAEQLLIYVDIPLFGTLTDDKIFEAVEEDVDIGWSSERIQRYSADANVTYLRYRCTEEAIYVQTETYY
ncbi:hypothetical protein T06_14542 [Trichinella sp. T6]|nr:hypothetical protein T06_14542 [Trichinella sp. T6]